MCTSFTESFNQFTFRIKKLFAFQKDQLAAEGPTAALEYRERQKATLEYMKRLRALRLAMPTGAKKHSRRASRT